jgi:XRE family transcriptional regulator, regulator of sulfur utilization
MKGANHSRHVARAFGQALRAARMRRGISQDRLGELCDCDRTYPSLLERGFRGPTVAMLLRLSGGLGVEPEQLFADMMARLRH